MLFNLLIVIVIQITSCVFLCCDDSSGSNLFSLLCTLCSTFSNCLRSLLFFQSSPKKSWRQNLNCQPPNLLHDELDHRKTVCPCTSGYCLFTIFFPLIFLRNFVHMISRSKTNSSPIVIRTITQYCVTLFSCIYNNCCITTPLLQLKLHF